MRRHCDDDACRRFVERDLADRREQTIQRQLLELRTQLARRRRITKPDAYPIVDLPAQRAPIVRLPMRRREAFREYLEALVEWVWGGESGPAPVREPIVNTYWRDRPPEPVQPATQRTIARACSVCKGACCVTGAGHAWLDARAIRRQIAAHPDRTPREIVDAYVSAIRPRSYRDSCVYHGPAGCTLPSAMRADICGNFFCPPTHRVRIETARSATVQVFFAVTDARGRRRGHFIDERNDPPAQ